MFLLNKKLQSLIFTVFCLANLFGYQPQLGSLPRWNQGIGIQGGGTFSSYSKEKKEYQIYSTWLEETYSFTREIGVTLRQSYFYETEQKNDFLAFYLTMPMKLFFDAHRAARNFFLKPTFVYIPTSQKGFGGASIGFFHETFRTYFVVALKTMFQLNDKPAVTRSFEGEMEAAVKSDFGYHFLYDKENNSGLWALLRAQFHTEIEKSHLTLQPSLMGYWDSINGIVRFILPIWQESKDQSLKNYGISIGVSSAW